MMNKFLLTASFLLLVLSCNQKEIKKSTEDGPEKNVDDPVYADYFTGRTLRFDLFHSGTAAEEHFAPDRIVNDGAWGGSKTNLTDKLELGPYLFEVLDKQSARLLYSRGYSSIFFEWQTIPEAKNQWGTFSESLRFPWPVKPVTIMISKRDSLNRFNRLWNFDIDPDTAARQVNHAGVIREDKVDIIADNGSSENKLDLVILGDGYSEGEMDKFRKDAERLSGYLLNAEPFRSRRSDFNIRAIETPSTLSGVNKPHHRIYRRTPLSVSYSSFGSERYALTFDNRSVRDVASQVPYDFMVILVNERTYGGGGIYNLYTTVSADNKFAEYIMVHELGHCMAALADEYYTSSVAYDVPDVKTEPWETNITALLDPLNLKWKDLVSPETPLPTPWNKDVFDRYGYSVQKERDSLRSALVPETEMEDLFTRQLEQENLFFSKEKYGDKVGAFEGAGYMARGLYRPQVDCIMYTRHLQFCRVCMQSINNVIDQYVK